MKSVLNKFEKHCTKQWVKFITGILRFFCMLGVLFILLFAVTKYLTKTNYKQRNEFGLKSKGIVHCRESIMATGAFRLWLYCSSSKEVGHGHWGFHSTHVLLLYLVQDPGRRNNAAYIQSGPSLLRSSSQETFSWQPPEVCSHSHSEVSPVAKDSPSHFDRTPQLCYRWTLYLYGLLLVLAEFMVPTIPVETRWHASWITYMTTHVCDFSVTCHPAFVHIHRGAQNTLL